LSRTRSPMEVTPGIIMKNHKGFREKKSDQKLKRKEKASGRLPAAKGI